MVDRRRLSASYGFVLALLLVAGAAACGGKPQSGSPGGTSEKRTVVLVTIDTLRADRLGCYGRSGAGTPWLDKFAAEGTRFAAAQTTAPITLPAHASILTGRTLPAHGVVENGVFALPAAVPTLSEAFRKAGYATGAIVSSKILAATQGLARGFDLYDDSIASPDQRRGPVLNYAARSGVETVDRALGWLGSVGDQPAFLWVHIWEPHAPYHALPEQRQMFPGDPYQAAVATADVVLGRLHQGLAAQGRAGGALMVIAGDHGEGLSDHGEETHGVFLYSEVMHVPLIVFGPAHGIRPAVIEDPVSLADIAPTLVELSKLGALDGADGLSLAAAVTGRGPAPARPGVFAESHTPQLQYGWSGLRAIVSGRTKVIDAPRPEFYDAATDPGEKRDLAGQRPADVAAGRRALLGLLERARSVAPEEEEEVPVSEEQLATLRSLGYAASGRRGDDRELIDARATDPKDRAEFIAKYDRALAASESANPASALPLFAALDPQEPQNPAFLESYGRALILSGQLDKALEVFNRAVKAEPGFSLAWLRIGQILDNRKDQAGAEAAYRQAIATDRFSLQAHMALAGLLMEQKRGPAALEVLERARELDRGNKQLAATIERLKARSQR